eukprot:TRINITY_DN1385_c0_g1_i2.p1 TRINITY_DN1385_c0_g1~~TRINITY_DN1385_c0_g1_i2.p1  ORF type:complete len:453 (-),score=66.91 TRINITY_DN1385_c0_g1_i2:2591-3949(-)
MSPSHYSSLLVYSAMLLFYLSCFSLWIYVGAQPRSGLDVSMTRNASTNQSPSVSRATISRKQECNITEIHRECGASDQDYAAVFEKIRACPKNLPDNPLALMFDCLYLCRDKYTRKSIDDTVLENITSIMNNSWNVDNISLRQSCNDSPVEILWQTPEAIITILNQVQEMYRPSSPNKWESCQGDLCVGMIHLRASQTTSTSTLSFKSDGYGKLAFNATLDLDKDQTIYPEARYLVIGYPPVESDGKKNTVTLYVHIRCVETSINPLPKTNFTVIYSQVADPDKGKEFKCRYSKDFNLTSPVETDQKKIEENNADSYECTSQELGTYSLQYKNSKNFLEKYGNAIIIGCTVFTVGLLATLSLAYRRTYSSVRSTLHPLQKVITVDVEPTRSWQGHSIIPMNEDRLVELRRSHANLYPGNPLKSQTQVQQNRSSRTNSPKPANSPGKRDRTKG